MTSIPSELRENFLRENAQELAIYGRWPLFVLGILLVISGLLDLASGITNSPIFSTIEIILGCLVSFFSRWLSGGGTGNWSRLCFTFLAIIIFNSLSTRFIQGPSGVATGNYLLIFATALCLRQANDIWRLTVPAAVLGDLILEPWNATAGTVYSIIFYSISAPIGAYFCGRMLENARMATFLGKIELATRAQEDFLTGLPNRRHFEERLQSEYDQFARYGSIFSVSIFDIDHFKSVNDTYGHKVGDEALKHVATVLQKSKRASDFLARWGGEEFAVLLHNADKDSACLAVERMRMSLENLPFSAADGTTIGLTASAGVATPNSVSCLNQIMERADHALYQAKSMGRSRTVHEVDGKLTSPNLD